MNTEALIVELSRLGVRITVDGKDLKVAAPKGVLTQELRLELSEKKEDILGMLAPTATEKALVPISRNQTLALSAAQERFLLLSQLYPESVAYNLPNLHRLDGLLDCDAFEQSITSVVLRHEALRTCFRVANGVATQNIATSAHHAYRLEDLSDRPDPINQALALSDIEANLPFDLESGPLLRVVLYRCSPSQHIFCWTLHHSISDGWSSMLFLRELKDHYEAITTGRSLQLPLPPVQYADFGAWEREQIHNGVFSKQLQYWQKRFETIPPTLSLPLDHSRPGIKTYVGKSIDFDIGESLVSQCKAVSREHSVTLFTLLLAAFNIMLHRYSGETDICIGTPIARRNNTETQSVYGCFINTLAIRSDLSDDPAVANLLSDTRTTCLAAFANQDIPFENILEAVNPSRDTSSTPLFQAMFIFHVQDDRKVDQLGDISLSPLDIHADAAKFDITLELTETETGIRAFIEYSTDLFEASTIERMAGHYKCLLAGMVEAPQSCISALPLLEVQERNNLQSFQNPALSEIVGNEATDSNTSAEKRSSDTDTFSRLTLPMQFAQIANQNPSKIALICDDRTLRYQQLDLLSDCVAQRLLEQGEGRGSIVGVCMNRSIELVVALLGVMKVGAAYLPLDPSYPNDRLLHMLKTAQVDTLLTDSLETDICESYKCRRIDIEQLLNNPPAVAADKPKYSVDLTDLAYVIFTSGSTGNPKGVQVSQRSMMNFLSSMSLEPGLNESDTLLSVTTLSFDISVLELFLPLMVAATVVVANKHAAADGAVLANELVKNKVTAMQATPSTWQLMLESGWNGSPGFKALCGGEPIPNMLIKRLQPCVGELWNMYGPTETTVWSTCYKITDPDDPALIGKPIANTQCYVLDSNKAPVPIGVPGELYIGGKGVSVGYLNDPDQTHAHFLENPFASSIDGQLYRTGDSVRWRANGNLEYLARVDDQVKIRGHRIELGEVETAIVNLEGVKQAAVKILINATTQDAQMVGYVVADRVLTVSDMRQDLGLSLPAYMIPTSYMFTDALPLTANGKIDKKALPELDSERPRLGTEFVSATGDTESAIATIWMDILNLDSVGVNDNFFDLGGHSLLLVKIHASLQGKFQTTVPLLSLFRHTTIKTQAQLLQGSAETVSLEHTNKRAGKQQQMLKRLKQKQRAIGS